MKGILDELVLGFLSIRGVACRNSLFGHCGALPNDREVQDTILRSFEDFRVSGNEGFGVEGLSAL